MTSERLNTPLFDRLKWLPRVYLLLVGLSLGFVFIWKGSLSGVWFVLLTSPWSELSVPIIDGIDPSLMDAGLGIAVGIAGAFLNAAVLHFLLRWLSNPPKSNKRHRAGGE